MIQTGSQEVEDDCQAFMAFMDFGATHGVTLTETN